DAASMMDDRELFLLLQWPFFPTSLSFYLSIASFVELMPSTTKNLIFGSASNLILLRTIAMPSLAKDLNIANSEFDQGWLIKGNHRGVRFRDYRVSKTNQGKFNRRV